MSASFFADRIGDEVERAHYPADPPGKALPLWLAMWEGGKTALLAVLIYLCAAPLLLFAGFGAVIFFLATAYILSREYFELAAMRFRPPAEAKLLRKRNAMTVYIGGLFIAAFVSIPIVNLATPLFAMALMVHVHKRLSRERLAPRSLTCSRRTWLKRFFRRDVGGLWCQFKSDETVFNIISLIAKQD